MRLYGHVKDRPDDREPRGFEDVTIAEAAAAAGVSTVTVFSHFERKEDRLPDAVDIVRAAVRERAADTIPVKAPGAPERGL